MRLIFKTAAVMALFSGPVLAEETCDSYLPELDYCTTAESNSAFVTKVSMPDIKRSYKLSDDPSVFSMVAVIALPDAGKLDAQAMAQLVVHQFSKGDTPRFPNLDLKGFFHGSFANRDTVKGELDGLHAHGHVMSRYVVEGIQFGDQLVAVYTSTTDEMNSANELRAFHGQSMRNFKVSSQ